MLRLMPCALFFHNGFLRVFERVFKVALIHPAYGRGGLEYPFRYPHAVQSKPFSYLEAVFFVVNVSSDSLKVIRRKVKTRDGK